MTVTKTSISPYVTFYGRCKEAVEFYKSALDAEVEMMMTFDQAPDPVPEGMLQPGFEQKVMHAQMNVGGATIMASDGCGEEGAINGISLALNVSNEADAKRFFQNLSAGGEVTMPMGQTFWSPCFGMVKDKFGVHWMVSVPGEGQ